MLHFSLQIQEFSKSIAQDSSYRFQDKRLVINFIQFFKSLLENSPWVNTNDFVTPSFLYTGGSGNALAGYFLLKTKLSLCYTS